MTDSMPGYGDATRQSHALRMEFDTVPRDQLDDTAKGLTIDDGCRQLEIVYLTKITPFAAFIESITI